MAAWTVAAGPARWRRRRVAPWAQTGSGNWAFAWPKPTRTRSGTATRSSARYCGVTCAAGSPMRTSMTSCKWCSRRSGGSAAGSTRSAAWRPGCSRSRAAGPSTTYVPGAGRPSRSRMPRRCPVRTGGTIASRVEDTQDMQVALAQLPTQQREAIEMAYYADLTQREIAERLDVPLGTIKARTSRGLRRLSVLIASPAALLRGWSPGGPPGSPSPGLSGAVPVSGLSRAVPASRSGSPRPPARRTGRSTPPPHRRRSVLRAGRRRPR